MIGDDNVTVSLFDDHDALTRATPVIEQGACFVATNRPADQSPANLTYVQGDNWIAFPEIESTARQVTNAIGGSLHTIDC